MGAVDAIEWACVLCGCRIQNDWVEQRICIKFCVKLEHSFTDIFQMIQKAATMGNRWLTALWWQYICSCIIVLCSFLAKHQITQVTQRPLQARFAALKLLSFPKTKITFEREEISDHWWNSGKYYRAADGNWENCVRSQGAYFEGDWGVIVLCSMVLVSGIFNKCLYFPYYMAGYLLDRPRISLYLV